MAEKQGFEPWRTCALPVFKTGAFDHSAISPQRSLYKSGSIVWKKQVLSKSFSREVLLAFGLFFHIMPLYSINTHTTMNQSDKPSETMRLQKYLSQAGICSRRKAEEYITRGLVTINGKKASLGQSVNPREDEIVLNDRIIEEQSDLVYYKLNKPRDIITTCKQDGESSILDIVNIPERVFPIGRLDKETT